ncbi:MAG: bifunctional phosphopantothenoylcysteine decarboxylase/phosphopantothenate--cysteine ligase CoaBC [bacterium]|nr:bifunctional phosphopantothenoylcysteine decarboxylase/phosphopantothenate--cysteine ligase CoaBC [bacterium]
MPTVLFGITGSIAAYKALDIIRDLMAEGVEVVPILSEGGAKFVTRTTLEALTGRAAMSEVLPENSRQEIGHIVLARQADLLVTCPASADIIAKYAMGIADDPLALIALAFGTPHLIAPAMNHRMWENPATKHNVEILKERGIEFIGPDKGLMACGEEGWGRLSPLDEIYGRIMAELGKSGPLSGRRVLVSAGGTREAIDDVRYITNQSSGRMGHAIAEAARDLGAKVVLVTASDLKPPAGIQVEHVGSAEEMAEIIFNIAESHDAVIMSAAVADFTPVKKVNGKIKKGQIGDLSNIELKRTRDILRELGTKKPVRQLLVGFAAEFGPEGKEEALRKMKEKSCDLMCLNDVSRSDIGFCSEHNEISVLFSDGEIKHLPKNTKKEIAKSIMLEVAAILKKNDRH